MSVTNPFIYKQLNYLRSSASKSGLLPPIILCLLTVFSAFGQDSGHQLLWKISAADNSRVSYLYGTMHLQDKRVFNISDSLLPAIKRSEVFALELHPDSMTSYIDDELSEAYKENIYKRILSEEDYKRLDDKFMAAKGMALEDYYTFNPDIVEAALNDVEYGTKDMPNFLDGYLYSIAFQNGKIISGLEQVEDQLELPEEIDDEVLKKRILEMIEVGPDQYRETVEKMITLYNSGEINAIHNFILENDQYDDTMVRRNKVMLSSMVEIMSDKSLFAAVGAAHLPGDEGLINLLRNEGFKVEAVAVTFNNSDNYEDYQPDPTGWFENKHPKYGLTLRTPIQPEYYQRDPLLVYYTPDLLSGLTFAYMLSEELPMPVISEKNIKGFLADYFSDDDNTELNIVSEREYKIDGQDFYECVVKNSDDEFLRFAINVESEQFMAFLIETTEMGVNGGSADAFFESISLTEPDPDATYQGEWRRYTNEKGAFSVEIPDVEMQDMDREVENPLDPEGEPYFMNIDFISDPQLDYNYLIRYNDQPEGYYLVNQEEILETLGAELRAGIELVGEPYKFEEQGVRGFIAYLNFFNMYNGVFKFYFRGNRSYALMAQAKEKGAEVDPNSRFFTSFKLEPFLEDEVSDFEYEDLFTMQSPAALTLFSEEEGTDADEFLYTKSYTATSANSGGLYMMETSKLNPLYRTKDINAYLDTALVDILEYQDSIAEKELININGILGIKARIVNPNSNVQQFIQTMYVDDHLVQLYTCLGQDEVNQGLQDFFLESFKYTRKKPKLDVRASKTKEIVAALMSPDTLQVKRGQTALLYHDFSTEDVDLLLTALPYKAIEIEGYELNNTDLIVPITKYGNKRHMEKLLDYYRLESTEENIKEEIVSEFLNFQDMQADRILMDLLVKNPPKRTDEYFLAFYQLEDNLDILKRYPRELAQLYSNDDFKDQLIGLYVDHMMGMDELPELFSELQERIIDDIPNQMAKYQDTVLRNQSYHLNENLLYYYMSIAESDPAVNAEDSGEILKQIFTPYAKDPWTKTESMLKYMAMGFTVEPDILKQYMDPFYSRYEIMEALVDAELSDLIPAEYLEPNAFTELCVYNYVGDYVSEYNNEVKKLGEIEDDGVTYGIYKIISTSDDSEPVMALGIISAPNLNDFGTNDAYTEFDKVKTAWKLQARSLIRQYKRAMREE